MTDYSRVERLALCDLFDELGPDQPTLCDGWTTYDLAVHLYVRESDPKAAPGIMISTFAETTEKRMERAKAKYGYAGVVGKVRNGPPRASIYGLPFIGHQLNTTEYLVHHEDVRRAQPEFTVRDLPAAQQAGLWKGLRLTSRAMTRKATSGIVLQLPTGQSVVAKQPVNGRTVTVIGAPVELVMFCFGRQEVADVRIEGDPAVIEELKATSFGF